MKTKRIAVKKEPVLHIHNWIVAVKKGTRTRFYYCVNKNEVKLVVRSAAKGRVIEIYRAHHNFQQALYVQD